MDAVEAQVARKRLARWPEGDRLWAKALPNGERLLVAELLALLDVEPVERGTED